MDPVPGSSRTTRPLRKVGSLVGVRPLTRSITVEPLQKTAAGNGLYGHGDPRSLPNYTLAESAQWLGLVPATLRSWCLGTSYPTQQGMRKARPVIEPAARSPLVLSFWNLVEANVLAAIRKTHGVSFQKVRKALIFVENRLGHDRPLIQAQFETDGVHLFVEQYGKLIAATQAGQIVIRELLQATLQRIDRDPSGLAARLYPWTHEPTEPRVVAIDPRVSFGRPTLTETGVPVEIIMERFRSGDAISHLAKEYHVERERVENVVRWAAGGAAAA
ncbi:MAG TPA: DUF433 domain-containing protein [Planctomycetota bacterium]|nr:DUF433 domain-containing protein [Planctomycetota bacterium]